MTALLAALGLGGIAGIIGAYATPVKVLVTIAHWTTTRREKLTADELERVKAIEANPSDAWKFTEWR